MKGRRREGMGIKCGSMKKRRGGGEEEDREVVSTKATV